MKLMRRRLSTESSLVHPHEPRVVFDALLMSSGLALVLTLHSVVYRLSVGGKPTRG